ncbi:MAG: 50S ribosomal protein L9 [Parcubacteria group bacterium GW2011_GWC1_43_11b]|uniref:Large ribosomal subunit protein bL9 n=2 Tax=Candidatus Vogeliibacteriota TaxID=1817922 RepID=A0A1G2QF80_9BACT|nr:MAG: 50S ribosomal protein L9 [Parcubacteria group bacterium GW2011_GWB1_42_9]KKS89213.1 MAG: 50S ribosomal protein L9 [Parcubacteria group bacterium GW2011_GWC1_43_11b]KKT09308.1 MAG: 50S ribosomal protein L9 [Parcubacteria group bacterium GW2011_GWA1_43_21]OHA59275.1 MAG: 50S ribosomal protein L9 [Candidatus Vogelbacteria bacterium RIFOXYB1_FULL_42_16]OHA60047.1 MAG: 50S ribosomal protein L9 [Candidatus Vogelbacteria bacterium RIFOXYD1_FULL_42_15]
MKIILLQDVQKLGKRNEVKEVADGFARNVLLPSKKAILATPEAVAQVKRQQADQTQSKARENEIFDQVVKQARGANLVIKAKAGKEGHLFASIKAEEIIAMAKTQGLDIKKDWLEISTPIKSLGEHEFILKKGEKREVVKIKIETNFAILI